jgi:hypothetical protein
MKEEIKKKLQTLLVEALREKKEQNLQKEIREKEMMGEIKKEVKEEIQYHPQEEKIGPDVAPKDDGSDVKYQTKSWKRKIKTLVKVILH